MPHTMAGQLLLDLPSELVSQDVLSKLAYLDLLRAGMTCKRMRALTPCNKLWRKLFEDKWGEVSPVQEAAAKLAGGFLPLYRSKYVTDANGNGWSRPSEFELRAVLVILAQRAAAHAAAAVAADVQAAAAASGTPCGCDVTPSSPTSILSAASVALSPAPSTSSTTSSQPSLSPQHPSVLLPSPEVLMMGCEPEVLGDAPPARAPATEVQLVYLLDGSGSVSEDDFNEMRRFVVTSAPILTEALGAGPTGKVGVVQFSTDTRVEMPLNPVGEDPDTLRVALDAIMRINGGTNIATAIAKAGSLMKADDQARAAAVAAAASATPITPRLSHPGSPTSAHATRSSSLLGMPLSPSSPTASPARAAAVAAAAAALAVPIAMRTPPPSVPQWPAPPPPLATYSRDASMSGAEDRPSVFMEGAGPSGCTSAAPATPADVHVPPVRPIRLVLLLTDGRVDTYQAREARATACRLCDELAGCTLAAFGVGRGVDRTELLHIIDTQQGDAAQRYLDLYTRDDSPW